jgi:hypothetical protein
MADLEPYHRKQKRGFRESHEGEDYEDVFLPREPAEPQQSSAYQQLVQSLEEMSRAIDPVPPPTGNLLQDFGTAGLLALAFGMHPRGIPAGPQHARLPSGEVLRRQELPSGRVRHTRQGQFVQDPERRLPPWRP